MTDPRITAARVRLVRMPLAAALRGPFGTMTHRHNLLVTLETSGGACGVGEIWGNFPPWGCRERVDIFNHVVAPQLIDATLDDPARLYRALAQRLRPLANQWGAPGPVHQVLAGTDVALWDARARDLGLPLCDLIRGAPCGRLVPVYASGIGPEDPAAMIAASRRRGHRRFKVRLSFGPEIDRRTLAAAHDAAEGEPLMADASQSLTVETIGTLQPELDRAGLQWLEEPFLVDDEPAYRRWREIPGVPPLAMGENSYGLQGLTRLVDTIAPAVVQPDITKTSGVSEGFAIGRMVVAAGKRLCFHMFGGPVGLYTSAHLAAAIDGSDWVEMDANPNPLFDTVVDIPPAVENGCLRLPAGSGLGIEIREPAIARHLVALS